MSAIPVQLGPQGRIVIPAAIRHALGLEPGAQLVAVIVDSTIVLQTPQALLARFYSRFSEATSGSPQPAAAGASVADELIAERRAEARREGA